MISWRILSWPRVISVWPMRFAGTWSRYSNSAIPQLTRAATYHGRSLRFLRWAYQANVMKTLERASRLTVRKTTGIRRTRVKDRAGWPAQRAEPWRRRAPGTPRNRPAGPVVGHGAGTETGTLTD